MVASCVRWNNVTDCGIYFCANPVNCGTHQLVGEEGGEVKPSPTARERRLLALAKYWKEKAQEAERKESELRKAVERQAKSILSVIHS